ncbi:Miniconductance mechanosensitive channel [Pantoea agglomerans]|uniref:Miniconductance mechanosensitive channel n=1 Tax=Enterobacter agglomerans TaxID=549 RepID=A0A379AGD4_ENTAG|nr:Miniconductance mechanosensitive channel [Pantoea agglomerans]
MLQLGDWIEMPDRNISGEVIDIALHTITIRNWDNTISRIPTKNFLTETYTKLAGDVLPRAHAASCAAFILIRSRSPL